MANPTEIFKIRLGVRVSLDVVRLVGEGRYLIVFCEDGPIKRRTVAHLTDADAGKVGEFLSGRMPRPFSAPSPLPRDEAAPEEVAREITETVIGEDSSPTKVD